MNDSSDARLLEQTADIWRLEYEKRVRVDMEQGRIEPLRPDDRRKLPRLKLRTGKNIWIHTERAAVPILNLSAEGIAFYSDTEQFVGDVVHLNVADTVSIEATVIECALEETDALFMEYRYRVRARFAPGVNGYRVYVLARDIYIYNLEQHFGHAMAN